MSAKQKLLTTKPTIVKLLYQLTYDVIRMLDLFKIKYWAIGGTFLGCIRHKGLIPWDDDVDIGIFSKDIKTFLSLAPNLKKCGYNITKTFFGYKVFYDKRRLTDGLDYSFPNLDVFVYKPDSTGKRYIMSLKDARDTWPKEYYAKSQIDKLERHYFGSFKVYTPSDYNTYLSHMYGTDWNTVAYREYDHQKEDFVDKVKVKLTEKDRVPAEPIDVVDRRCLNRLCIVKQKVKSSNRLIRKLLSKCKQKDKNHYNFDFKMGTYVINCPVHVDRLERFSTYAKKAKLNFCIENCVSSKELNPSMVCDLIKKHIVSPKASMTQTELAICLSHYNVWNRIINNCEDYGLVFEDDCHFPKDIVKKINNYMNDITKKGIDFDTFYLFNGNWGKEDVEENLEKVANGVYRETDTFNAGGVAYIISKKFCKKLINKMFPIKMPQDVFMGFVKGTHLTLKMKYYKKDECFNSNLVWVDCGGEGGTGNTTQMYDNITINKIGCHNCN